MELLLILPLLCWTVARAADMRQAPAGVYSAVFHEGEAIRSIRFVRQ